jgi:hypothetical protein
MVAVAAAGLIGTDLAVLLARFGAGGYSLNTFFDTLGLEGALATTTYITILFQIVRWFYTTFYAVGRPWSPFVFVCMLIGAQVIHDLIVNYGVFTTIPAGKNEMIDALKRYAAENGSRALSAHVGLLIVVAILAMFLKESSAVFALIVVSISVYALPFVLNTAGPKPPPPPPPPKKEAFGPRF